MKKKNILKIETVKALIIVKTYFKNLSCVELYDKILNEKEIFNRSINLINIFLIKYVCD
jgi:hypothetical protein